MPQAALGGVRALIAAHGAGLANCVFLPPSATVLELDAAAHAAHNRPFYGQLAAALGLRYAKVWLDAAGAEVAAALAPLPPLAACRHDSRGALPARARRDDGDARHRARAAHDAAAALRP